MSIRIKRVYEPPAADDGLRVLVDRLWPRGLKRETATLHSWLKEVAPSPSLRTWFDHRADRFAEFTRRYRKEVAGNPALAELKRMGKRGTVTLVYGARDPQVNHASVLLSLLRSPARRPSAAAARK